MIRSSQAQDLISVEECSLLLQALRQQCGGGSVVVAFSSRVRIRGECSTPHFLPALFFLSGD